MRAPKFHRILYSIDVLGNIGRPTILLWRWTIVNEAQYSRAEFRLLCQELPLVNEKYASHNFINATTVRDYL